MAPSSPRNQTWNRRVLSWGCAPMMIAGLVVGFVPTLQELGLAVGAGLALLLGIPVTVYALWLRRENRNRYEHALAEADDAGMRVRAVETEEGDFEYVLEEFEHIEPLSWDDG